MALIPKSIEDKGQTLTLGDVRWSESAGVDGEGNPVTRYTATASYTGSVSSRYATGYTVSASYTGKVSKPNCAVVTYTAIFGSEKAPEESEAPDSDGNHNPGQTGDAGAPDAVEEPAEQSGLKRPMMIGVVVLALAGGGVFAFKKWKERR